MEATIASGLAQWGVPGALLLAVGGGFWRLLLWVLAENKRREEQSLERETRLMQTLNGVTEKYVRVTQLLDGLVSSVIGLHASQERLVADVGGIHKGQERLVRVVETLLQRTGVDPIENTRR